MVITTSVEAHRRSWIGQPLKRKEDKRFITGAGRYVDDIQLDEMLYAAILRTPYSHAKLKKVDVSKALELDGVVAALTGNEVAKLTRPFGQLVPPPGDKMKDYCMAVDKARYAGEPVAAVVAEDRYTAYDALDFVEVDYEPLPAIVDAEEAMKPQAPLVHEEVGTNVLWHETFHYGDINNAFKEADLIVEDRLVFHRFSSTPMETNGVIASFDPRSGSLTIWCNNHMPMFSSALLIDALGFPSEKLRVVMPDNGGGFGVKTNNYPYMLLASLLSMKTGRPVKWIESRREHLLAAGHGNERVFYVQAAVKNDGVILGLKVKTIDNEGAYLRYEPVGVLLWIHVGPGCYRIRNISMEVYSVATNKCPVAPNRGYGRMQHQFMVERIVDRVARKLRIDPAEVRFRNFIQPDDFPYTTPTGAIYDSGNYPKCLSMALNELDYHRLREEQKRLRGLGRYVGIGLAAVIESGTNSFSQVRLINKNLPVSGTSEAAFVRVDPRGRVIAAVGSAPQGQGHETVTAQIVADVFDLHPDEVTVLQGFDQALNPHTLQSGTFASRFAAMGVGAVVGAAAKARDKVFRIASHVLEARLEDLEFKGGRVFVKGSSVSVGLDEVAQVAYRNTSLLPEGVEPGISELFVYKPNFGLPDGDKRGNFMLTYANQVHAAFVEVDVETGVVKILRYAIVHDAGKEINPLIVEGQVQGAAAHSIFAALYENFKYDQEGQLLNTSFMDYFAPTAVETPTLEVSSLETPSPFSTLGAKGVGEGGGAGLPAIANAIEDALSPFEISITNSHNSPEELFNMIRDALSKK